MAVLVHLNDNGTVRVDIDYESMREAYRDAVERNQLLEIKGDDEITRAVNPQQIVFFEEEARDSAPATPARPEIPA
jgi:hypothetical protein